MTDQELEELQKEKEERREQFEKQIAELMKEYQKRIQVKGNFSSRKWAIL